MIIHILITIVFYFVLMYLSVNLLGFLVRGLFVDPELDRLKQEDQDFIKQEVIKLQKAEKWANVIALILIIVFFYLLFHFWNIGVVIAAIIIMAGRLPDLLWEIKHGKKMTFSDANSLPKNVLFFISSFSFLISLPLLYYSLYLF